MSNIVSFAEFKAKKEAEHLTVKCEPNEDSGLSFEEIAERNKKNEERVKAERLKHNSKVKRDNRLSDK